MKRFHHLFILFFLQLSPAAAQPQVSLELVADGLGYIVDIAHAGDDRLFILTRHGQIRIVQDGIALPTPYLDISSQVTTGGEMGSLGLTFDPDFQNNGRFYVHYNAIGNGWWSRISRFTASDPSDQTVDPATEQILFIVEQPSTFHNGGDVDMGPDGMLYLTLGDSFNSETAQDPTHPLGSIHRIDVSDGGDTYTIPGDNPYANSTGDTLKTIWAKGLRNPFRFGFDALTGDMWIGDVGSSNWEEVNFWPAGDHSGPNFGWRCFEGFVPATPATPGCGSADQYDMPVAVQPTSGAWCSVIGGRVYRGASFPELYGRYIYSDYCAGVLMSLLPDGEEWVSETLYTGIGSGVTCIGENSDLELFLGRSNGSLYRIIDELNVSVPEVRSRDLMIYPNPASELISIEGLPELHELRMLDNLGRRIDVTTTRSDQGILTIDISRLSAGIHFLSMTDLVTGEVINKKIAIGR